MLFDDEEIGGKTLTPATKRYFGNFELADQYLWRGQLLLGELKRRMQQADIPDGHVDAELPGPVYLKAKSNQWGLADIDEIWIDVRAISGGATIASKCIGFLVRLYKDGDLPAQRIDAYVKGAEDQAGEYMWAWLEDTSFGYFLGPEEVAEPSLITTPAIPGTYDSPYEETLAPEYSGAIVHGRVTYTLTVQVDYPPSPSYILRSLYDPPTYPNLSLANFVGLNSWAYEVQPGLIGGQLNPRIYLGGYIENVPPVGLRFKADPVPGSNPNYSNEVVANGDVDAAQEMIGGANYRLAEAAGEEVAIPQFLTQYTTWVENWKGTQANLDGYTLFNWFAPTRTIRNKFNHISMLGVNPALSGGTIECNHQTKNSFISVLPGDITYAFSDPYWVEHFTASVFSGEDNFVEVDDYVAGVATFNMGFQVTETSTEFFMDNGSFTLAYPWSPGQDRYIHRRNHLTDTPSIPGFTAPTTVPDGEYRVQCQGSVEITLVFDNIPPAVFRHTPADTSASSVFTEEIAIQIGQPFTEDYSEIITVRPVTTQII